MERKRNRRTHNQVEFRDRWTHSREGTDGLPIRGGTREDEILITDQREDGERSTREGTEEVEDQVDSLLYREGARAVKPLTGKEHDR